jgi:uncharacterized protein
MAGALNRPYWENANAGRLVAQRCRACSHFLGIRGDLLCPVCGSESLEWQQLSGRARLHSFTIARQTTTRGFEDEIPYVVVLAEVVEQEGLLVLTNLIGDARNEELLLGAPLIVDFELRGDQRIPQFRLDRTADVAH